MKKVVRKMSKAGGRGKQLSTASLCLQEIKTEVNEIKRMITTIGMDVSNTFVAEREKMGR